MSLTQCLNLMRPAVRQWESQCPPGTRIEMFTDNAMNTLEIVVNGRRVASLFPEDLRYNTGAVEHVRSRVFAAAGERDQAAADRSAELLRSHLTDTQKETLDSKKYFEVVGGVTGKTYRIKSPPDGRNVIELYEGKPVTAYDAKPMLGRSTRNTPFAIHHEPLTPLPWGDVLLGQKLTLENNEAEFLRIACSSPINDMGYPGNWRQMTPAELNAGYQRAFIQYQQNLLQQQQHHMNYFWVDEGIANQGVNAQQNIPQNVLNPLQQGLMQHHAGNVYSQQALAYPPGQTTPQPIEYSNVYLVILSIFAFSMALTGLIHALFQ